jgi:ABC-type methionine transport system ATPase subunit
VGLAHLARRQARVLSGGEQQRLALARAWALRPALLFLDEPTASLDPAAAKEVERIVGEIHAAGTAIVMTTHSLGLARALRRRDPVPARGRLTEQTPAERFFHAPHSAEAAQFLRGELPWNRLAASARAHGRIAPAGRSLAAAARAQDFITVASTTSTEQSGLFKHLLPEAEKALGLDVRVVALGTGQALDMARRGDADVVFVHDQAAEEKFIAEGFGVKRYEVMYNDFVTSCGPKGRPGLGQGQRRGGGPEEDRREQIGIRLARRQERHARGGAALLEMAGVETPKGACTARPARAWAPR